MTIRVRRIVSAGALAVATLAAPLAISVTGGAGQAVAGPACLATGSFNGQQMPCLSYSNGNATTIGTPFGTYGPNGAGGFGTGALLPGQTWTQGVG